MGSSIDFTKHAGGRPPKDIAWPRGKTFTIEDMRPIAKLSNTALHYRVNMAVKKGILAKVGEANLFGRPAFLFKWIDSFESEAPQ